MRCEQFISFSQENELNNFDYVEVRKVKELSKEALAELDDIIAED